MMPKGVEHGELRANGNWYCPVKIPMMPKGVEHIDALQKRSVITE